MDIIYSPMLNLDEVRESEKEIEVDTSIDFLKEKIIIIKGE